ncbi:hypothetical protein Y032_0040g310 [Ancylostoma ceylanicum]|uniref:Lipid-binding serum glycoprotein N-terminal domain-containing protein n=2 Tax=Ancylostoma ceylanicum TaxID=53326 RepID=A0A016UIH7_9BILA|nr:hypothetical protein Y032_0040g310 [Ancylostoma ceylanicum]
MVGILLLFALASSHLVLCENQANLLFEEPLTVTISSKVWNLLDKSALITDFMKSIRIPETSSNDTMLDYKVSDIFLEDFQIPKSGVSFKDMNNGIHLLVTGLQFRAVATAKVAVGVSRLKAGMKGDVRVNCDYAELDLKLEWNDYNITPNISIHADLQVEFTESLRAANLFKEKIRGYAEDFISDTLPGMIVELFEQHVNAPLQKLKKLLTGMGLSQFGIEWTVQNKTLRIAVKPRRVPNLYACSAMGKVEPIKPTDKMVCITSDLLAALRELKRSKREVMSTSPPQLERGIDLTCSTLEGECTETSCSYCVDLDLEPSTTGGGISAEVSGCVPANL